jgi:hypothetical protein
MDTLPVEFSFSLKSGLANLYGVANRNCLLAAHACHSKNFDRPICRCQKSEREDAIPCEKGIKNKARINPAEHFLQCKAHNEFVKSGIARARSSSYCSGIGGRACHGLAVVSMRASDTDISFESQTNERRHRT